MPTTNPAPAINADAVCHIHYLQFNSHGQRPLFAERSDYVQLLDLFDQLQQEQQVATLVFCLLPHSIHWVIQAPDEHAQALGQWLQATYTHTYNERQQRNGSLFHKQVISRQVEPFRDFAELAHQIHYLPVAGKLVPDPAIYPWSSHKLYLGRNNEHPRWFHPAPLLNLIANQRASQIRRYSQFMAPAPRHLNHIEAVSSLQDHHTQLNPSFEEEDKAPPLELDELITYVCDNYRISTTDLHLWRRQRLMNEVKATIACLALQWQLNDLQALADELRIDQELLESGMRYVQQQKALSLHRLVIGLEKTAGPAPEPLPQLQPTDEDAGALPQEDNDPAPDIELEPAMSDDTSPTPEQDQEQPFESTPLNNVQDDLEAEIEAAIEAERVAAQ